MHHRRIVFLSPRFPWWGWILLLPLAVLGVFLGAIFFLVFIAFVVTAGLIMWIRWKWMLRKTGARGGPAVYRDARCQREYDLEIKRMDDSNGGPKR